MDLDGDVVERADVDRADLRGRDDRGTGPGNDPCAEREGLPDRGEHDERHGASRERFTEVAEATSGHDSATWTSSATSVGVRATFTPAASSASALACAVPLDPVTIAPAWPIRFPGGAVNPAM